jgi:hypothetical protein
MIFKMDDLEDLVFFFMNAPLDKPFSKAVLISVLCKINGAPSEDEAVTQDVEAACVRRKRGRHER